MRKLFFESVARGAKTLLFPPSCMNCGSLGVDICAKCKKYLTPKPRFLHGESFSIVSSLPYDETTGKLMLLAKERGIISAQKFFASARANSIDYFKIDYPISVIPIPSQPNLIRRRGFDSMKEIAKLIIKDPHLRTEIEILEALEIRRRVADQSSLTEEERIQNLEGALGVRPDISGKSVIVIDDVITTGSTLREAIRVLEERNLTVIGAATACATQRRLAIG